MVPEKSQWDYLIKPYKVAFDREKNPGYVDTMVVKPLERGFGTTLGNALRRVLLSSIEGSAVVSVKISGVLLEFSTIQGVYEDVTDIVINLKKLVLKLVGCSSKTVFVSAKGPCVVTSEMLECDGVQAICPEQVICTLNESGRIEMEISIEKGKGYRSAPSLSEQSRSNVGEILIDAHFSPIKRVSYQTEMARVGQHSDYDSLMLTVETNGSISPKDSISAAAEILRSQLSVFSSFETDFVPQDVIESEIKQSGSMPTVFLKKITELDLNVRCLNCLQNAGVVYVGDLVKKKESDLLKTPNFGRKSLNDINDALSRFGLSLGMDLKEWSSQESQESQEYLDEMTEGE